MSAKNTITSAYILNSYNNSSVYNINPTVVQGDSLTGVSSLPLIGTNYSGWGIQVSQNLLWRLENFYGATMPLNTIVGQVWCQLSSNSTNSYISYYNGNQYIQVTNMIIGPLPTTYMPYSFYTNSVTGMLYFAADTNTLLTMRTATDTDSAANIAIVGSGISASNVQTQLALNSLFSNPRLSINNSYLYCTTNSAVFSFNNFQTSTFNNNCIVAYNDSNNQTMTTNFTYSVLNISANSFDMNVGSAVSNNLSVLCPCGIIFTGNTPTATLTMLKLNNLYAGKVATSIGYRFSVTNNTTSGVLNIVDFNSVPILSNIPVNTTVKFLMLVNPVNNNVTPIIYSYATINY